MLSSKFAAELDSKWEEQKAKLKLMFPGLSRDDLAFDRTKKKEMIDSLKLKLGVTAKALTDTIER